MTDKEAIKLALKALHGSIAITMAKIDLRNKAIKALEEALAKQEQGEPVAWMDIDEKGAASGLRYWSEPDNRHEVALYTTPQQSTLVGLTEQEVDECYESIMFHPDIEPSRMGVYLEIEAKLKEKNT